MTAYLCPKCNRNGMNEDGRAQAFMCVYRGCNTAVDFNDFSRLAAAASNQPISRAKGLPTTVYRLSPEIVNAILNLNYLINQFNSAHSKTTRNDSEGLKRLVDETN